MAIRTHEARKEASSGGRFHQSLIVQHTARDRRSHAVNTSGKINVLTTVTTQHGADFDDSNDRTSTIKMDVLREPDSKGSRV